MGVKDDILAQGIANDAAYVGRLMRDLGEPRNALFAGIMPFCMAPYLSLIVHESYRKLKIIDPTLPSLLSSDAESIVARSRHSLKLFEDTTRGVEGQLAYFRDEVLPAHSNRFLGNTWLKAARFLETDLGLFSYAGRLIATTHSATFHLGVDPVTLLKEGAGIQLRAIYEEYGRYFAGLGATRFDPRDKTFVSRLNSASLDKRPNDVRGDKYYNRAFNGKDTPELNALLTVFRGMINFVDAIFIPGNEREKLEYTPFKIRFLTLYQVLRSVRIVYEEQPQDLSARSMRLIERITQTTEAKLITSSFAKPFRNTLMHYDLDTRADMTKVDVAQPLFGLVSIYFPSHDTTTFAEIVNNCIKETATVIEEWAAI